MFSVVIILIKSEKIPFNIEVTFETLQLSTQTSQIWYLYNTFELMEVGRLFKKL